MCEGKTLISTTSLCSATQLKKTNKKTHLPLTEICEKVGPVMPFIMNLVSNEYPRMKMYPVRVS